MHSKKFKIARIIFLILYIACAFVLIVESCQNGSESSEHSSNVGGLFADLINGIRGDQAVPIAPEAVHITNKDDVDKLKVHTRDRIKLSLKTTPENSSFQSYTYEVIDKDYASVDNNGNVSFLKSGKAEIKVTNKDYPTVYDTISFTITDVELTAINTAVVASELDKPDPILDEASNTYTLFKDISYSIKYEFKPANVTSAHVSFRSANPEILRVEEKGNLTPLKLVDKPVSIFVSTKESPLEVELKFKIASSLKTDLRAINDSELELFKNEEAIPRLIASMENKNLITNEVEEFQMLYKDFILSSDSSLVEIRGNKIIAREYGEAIVIAKAKNSDISAKIRVNIKKAPPATDFKITNEINELSLNKEHKIAYELLPNKYAEARSIEFISSDSSYASVDSNGVIRALKITTSPITIRVIINGISKELSLSIIPNREVIDNNGNTRALDYYKITPIVDNSIQYTNTEIPIASLFSYKAYDIYNKPIDVALGFSYRASKNATIKNDKITILAPGRVTILIHLEGYEDKFIEIYALDSFNVDKADIAINAKANSQINISPSNNLGYIAYLSNKNAKANVDKNIINISGIYEGNCELIIVPEIPNSNKEIDKLLKEKFSIKINIRVSNVIASSIIMDAEVMHYNEAIDKLEPTNINIYLNELAMLFPMVNKEATIKHFTFRVKDPNIAFVSNTGLIRPRSVGSTIIYVFEGYSKLSVEIPVQIRHMISIDKESPAKVTGQNTKYDKASNTFTIQNGLANTISLSFLPDSTYNRVSYKSLNEDIISVGSDGKITPHKKGLATVIAAVNDGVNPEVRVEIKIEVVRQDAIQDLQDFFFKVRKGIGHFGAFLILGIFSTLTYMMFFSTKWWLLAVPINFLQGFSLAALTEYLQTLVKGRYGCIEDVFLDYKGFIISAILITLAFIIIKIIKYKRENRNN